MASSSVTPKMAPTLLRACRSMPQLSSLRNTLSMVSPIKVRFMESNMPPPAAAEFAGTVVVVEYLGGEEIAEEEREEPKERNLGKFS